MLIWRTSKSKFGTNFFQFERMFDRSHFKLDDRFAVDADLFSVQSVFSVLRLKNQRIFPERGKFIKKKVLHATERALFSPVTIVSNLAAVIHQP